MDDVAISVTNLAYAYGNASGDPQSVFDNVSFQVGRGRIVCVVGPSGCGKSTLLHLIAGFLSPLRGNIHLAPCGHDVASPVGYIFQRDALLPWRTVQGNLVLADEIRKRKDCERRDFRIAEYLDIFNLDASVLSKYPDELSGGMRQRVSIVQALMAEPQILLLDEPFASLDFYTKLKLEAEFQAMVSERGKAALFVTHDIDEAIAMGNSILVMGPSPRGIIDQIDIEFIAGDRLSPEAIRGHARFGEYFTKVWNELRDSI